MQIDIRLVRQAASDGMVVGRKGNDEVVCGIRPDHLVSYVAVAEGLHNYGRRAREFRAIEAAVTRPQISDRDLAGLTAPRRRVVRQISALSRNSRFRHLVLSAYDHRCAITGMQLKLVDAAHILPVGAPGSTDQVVNGIALCPTFHRAYDRGLVFIDDSFCCQLNRARASELRRMRLDAGMSDLQQYSGHTIILPSNQSLRPSVQFIRRANRFRGIA